MIVKKILLLPSTITFEGITFELKIFINGSDECRLCYEISDVSWESKHFNDYQLNNAWINPFTDGMCDFLFLFEGISDDHDLIEAIDTCKCFLDTHKSILNA